MSLTVISIDNQRQLNNMWSTFHVFVHRWAKYFEFRNTISYAIAKGYCCSTTAVAVYLRVCEVFIDVHGFDEWGFKTSNRKHLNSYSFRQQSDH